MRTLLCSPSLAGSLLVLLCLGCGENGTSPTTPPLEPPPNATTGFIWGHVVRQSGVCITGAVVEIVAGPGTGRKAIQTEACDAWSYVIGYEFSNLPIGVTVKLRATKEGHQPQERETVVRNGGYPFQFVLSPE
jgi:hypothetical protein